MSLSERKIEMYYIDEEKNIVIIVGDDCPLINKHEQIQPILDKLNAEKEYRVYLLKGFANQNIKILNNITIRLLDYGEITYCNICIAKDYKVISFSNIFEGTNKASVTNCIIKGE